MKIRLDDRRALVTGGNTGIGRAIALALGAAGAAVAVNYVEGADAAEDVVRAIRAEGRKAVTVHADVTDPSSVRRMFEQIEQALGAPDILVNNAGIDGERALAWRSDLGRWRRVLDVNLAGAFYCAREALERMVAQRQGVIVNVTSVHEQIPWGGYSAYTASKAGLGMLTRTLAQEAARHGVRVLAVAPGAIRTPINESVWEDPRARTDLLRKIPMGRLGRPEEIARLVVVLASDVASYLTGTTLFVDGGMTLYADFAHGG